MVELWMLKEKSFWFWRRFVRDLIRFDRKNFSLIVKRFGYWLKRDRKQVKFIIASK